MGGSAPNVDGNTSDGSMYLRRSSDGARVPSHTLGMSDGTSEPGLLAQAERLNRERLTVKVHGARVDAENEKVVA